MLLKEKTENGVSTLLCDSSNVLLISYDHNTKVLEIVFGKGQKYKYKGVPAYHYIRIRDADSQGKKISELMGKGRGKELYGETKVGVLGDGEIEMILEQIEEAKTFKK